MALPAKSSALAALMLLSYAAVVMCVRNAGSAEGLSTSNAGPIELIASLTKAVLTAKDKGDKKAEDYLVSKFKFYNNKQTVSTGDKTQLDSEGWEMFCTAVVKANCDDIWSVVKKGQRGAEYIKAGDVADIVLGGGVSLEVDEVLDAVWQWLEEQGGDGETLTKDQLVCRKEKTQQAFIDEIARVGGGKPVTKDVFKAYYNSILEGLGHQHKVLMIVNAWHLTGGPDADTPIGRMPIYDYINTVNIRARCVGGDHDGQIVMLRKDCGAGLNEDHMNKLDIIRKRLAEEGINCDSVSTADRLG